MDYKTKTNRAKKSSQSARKTEKHQGQDLNGRMFLASSQCCGSKDHYLFAFGPENLN